MNLLDLYEGREPYQQAIDKLEQARIDHLKEKMDYYAKHRMAAEFKKAKEEHDSYFKVQDECMGYGSVVGEGDIEKTATGLKHRSTNAYGGKDIGRGLEFARQKDAMDLTNVNKDLTKRLERGMGVDFNREETDEAGIGQDIVNKQEKMARATPSTPAGKVASTVKNAAKWLAGKGGPGKEGPTYEGQDQKKNSEEVEEGYQDFNKVEPYEVCLAGKPVKTFDYYEDARRFHDNWKKKLYAQGDKAKADRITLNPVMKEAANPAQQAAIAIAKKKEQGVAEVTTDYSKRRQRERDVDAGKPVAKPRQPKMTDYQRRRAQQKKEMELGEDQDTSGVEQAILNRIMVAHLDLLKQFGPQKVMQAAEEVAYNVGDVDEIGTSDVSAYVHQVKQILGAE